MIDRILAPLDGTRAAEAGLYWAEYAARRCRASVHLFTVLDRPDIHANGHLEKAQDYLQTQAESLRSRGVTVEHDVAAGPAAEFILAQANASDLTVMTYGTSRWLFGGVLDRVLQEMTRPLVVVRASPGKAPAPVEVRKVLVPLDSASYSGGVLPVAQTVAEAMGAPLVLCHTVAPVGHYRDPAEAPPGVAHAMQALLDDAHSFLSRTAEDLQAQGFAVESVVSLGDAAQEINRLAGRCGAGLIAMATRSRAHLDQRVMGSIANSVVQSSHIPCLLTRPGERS